MTTLISTDRVNITQKNFQQILIRGDGKDQFNQIINKETSLQPPSKNLEIKKLSTVIDIGSNKGQFLLISRKFHQILPNETHCQAQTNNHLTMQNLTLSL